MTDDLRGYATRQELPVMTRCEHRDGAGTQCGAYVSPRFDRGHTSCGWHRPRRKNARHPHVGDMSERVA